MKRYALGLMTGTSLDGIDAALVEAQGVANALTARVVGHVEHELGAVASVLRAAASGEPLPAIEFLRAGRTLGERHAQVAEDCVRKHLPAGERLSLVAAHGQTICHAPGEGLSWQLLDPGPLAERLAVPVVWDLRQADLLAGGQGAPITPLADAALYGAPREPALVVNLGGIVNATWLPGQTREPRGGDVCPCNLLLDGLVERLVPGVGFDESGRRAARGTLSETRMAELMQTPGFSSGGTLGREQVAAPMLAGFCAGVTGDQAVCNVLADAVEAIARTLAAAAATWPTGRVILAGGGVRNRALVEAIRRVLAPRPVVLSDEVGVPSQAREAAGMAVLGLRSLDAAPATVPAITGASRPTVAGRWCHPASVTAPKNPGPEPAAAAHSSPEEALPGAERLDALPTGELLAFLHGQDFVAAAAVTPLLPALEGLVEEAAAALDAGRRLVYLGAGTSGRLGVLDASELPPTFSADPSEVLAFIAGGDGALRKSAEGAEDDPAGAHAWLTEHRIGRGDVVVGIAASGTTPVVLGGLAWARDAGASTALLCCANPPEGHAAGRVLRLATGAEAISGSTRMKAGTATKLTLNLLSTAVMVRRGKVWGGWMVDVKATNAKLRRRAVRILGESVGLSDSDAHELLSRAKGRVKLALAMHATGQSAEVAARRLDDVNGRLRELCGPPSSALGLSRKREE